MWSLAHAVRIAFASLVVLSLVLSSCVATVPLPTAEDQTWASHQWPSVTLADLTRGRDVYGMKCGACHSLYEPTAYPSERWPRLVDAMVSRAHLVEGERDLIVHYVVTLSRSGATH